MITFQELKDSLGQIKKRSYITSNFIRQHAIDDSYDISHMPFSLNRVAASVTDEGSLSNAAIWYDALYAAYLLSEDLLSRIDFMNQQYFRGFDFPVCDVFSASELNKEYRIIVFGAGGTASWFIPKLVKMVNTAKAKGMIPYHNVEIIIIDGDEVEDKNLIRQNFIDADIGSNKAKVLANRYQRFAAEGVSLLFIDKYVGTTEKAKVMSDKFIDIENTGVFKKPNLVINLIDNGETRKIIHGFYATDSIVPIIDVANDLYNGQLTMSLYQFDASTRSSAKIHKMFHNPSITATGLYNLYPEHMIDFDGVSVYSCADHDANAEEDQLFIANDTAASVLAMYLNTYFESGKFYYGAIEFVCSQTPKIIPKYPLYSSLLYVGEYAFDSYVPQLPEGDRYPNIRKFAQAVDYCMSSETMRQGNSQSVNKMLMDFFDNEDNFSGEDQYFSGYNKENITVIKRFMTERPVIFSDFLVKQYGVYGDILALQMIRSRDVMEKVWPEAFGGASGIEMDSEEDQSENCSMEYSIVA